MSVLGWLGVESIVDALAGLITGVIVGLLIVGLLIGLGVIRLTEDRGRATECDLRFEDEAGFHEDQAAMISEEAHAKELRVVASASAELASLLDELRYRNIEMHELRRARARAS